MKAAQVPFFVRGYPVFVLLAALIGLVSGFSYWLIAGRVAGLQLRPRPA